MARYVFHGGCVGCQSQEIYGEGRCAGCQCLEADWRLPDLSVSEYEAREIETERARRRIKGQSFNTGEAEIYLQEIKKTNEERRHQVEALKFYQQQKNNSSITDKAFRLFYRFVSGR
jgi:hypothetical protein